MKKKISSNPSKHRNKRTVIIAAIISTVVWISILLVLLNNVSGSTDPIRKVGDQFQVPSDWTLVSEEIEPPRFFCFKGGSCPELSRRWSTKTQITKEVLTDTLSKSGWGFTIKDDCNIPENRFGDYVSTCWADGVIDGYSISIWVTYNSNDETQHHITIDVRP